MAFSEEASMVVNAWQRDGNTSDKSDACHFLEETLDILGRSGVGLVRMDAGFYSRHIMSFLEGDGEGTEPVDYIVRAHMTKRVYNAISEVTNWYSNNKVSKHAAYAEIAFKGASWEKERRMVIVRTPKKGVCFRQRKLFASEEMLATHNFRAFVTTLKLSPTKIHQLYNQRGDCENKIKELKYDFSIDGFALKSFAAMEAAFRLVMVANNIMSLFKQKAMQVSGSKRLSTVKFQCIAIGSYLVTSGRKKVLKLAAEGKRRHFLEHIFDNLEHLKPPFVFS